MGAWVSVQGLGPRVGVKGRTWDPHAQQRGLWAGGTAERRREAQDGGEHGEGALPLSGAPSHKPGGVPDLLKCPRHVS